MQKAKKAHFDQSAYKIHYNNLCIWFGTWKAGRLWSESKASQSPSKCEISGRARQKQRLSRSKLKQAFLSDSDAELFLYLRQCMTFGWWKVRLKGLKNGQKAICTKRSCDIIFIKMKVIWFCLQKTISGSYFKQNNSDLVFQTRTIFLKWISS